MDQHERNRTALSNTYDLWSVETPKSVRAHAGATTTVPKNFNTEDHAREIDGRAAVKRPERVCDKLLILNFKNFKKLKKLKKKLKKQLKKIV